MIVTCSELSLSDRSTVDASVPLAGHAIIDNMYAGFYEAVATPGADRIARGEEWLQTNTLDGTKAHRGVHQARRAGLLPGVRARRFPRRRRLRQPGDHQRRKADDLCQPACGGCTQLQRPGDGLRMSRTPDQRVYSSGSYDAYSFTQCYVSLGAPDGADFAFAKCDPDGNIPVHDIPSAT